MITFNRFFEWLVNSIWFCSFIASLTSLFYWWWFSLINKYQIEIDWFNNFKWDSSPNQLFANTPKLVLHLSKPKTNSTIFISYIFLTKLLKIFIDGSEFLEISVLIFSFISNYRFEILKIDYDILEIHAKSSYSCPKRDNYSRSFTYFFNSFIKY